LTGSVGIVSEGIHSEIDLLASCIAYFPLRQSSTLPYVDHEFGHGKYEDMSGFVEAQLIVFVTGLIHLGSMIQAALRGALASSSLLCAGMAVMGISAVMNLFVL
jgi:divalent metal cation (Fe/Co/Zn/Cd) transporter